jgi:hypothetical protein
VDHWQKATSTDIYSELYMDPDDVGIPWCARLGYGLMEICRIRERNLRIHNKEIHIHASVSCSILP